MDERLEENIRLIGAYNPYRKKKFKVEKWGLTREGDNEEELIYKVGQFPQSLFYNIFNSG